MASQTLRTRLVVERPDLRQVASVAPGVLALLALLLSLGSPSGTSAEEPSTSATKRRHDAFVLDEAPSAHAHCGESDHATPPERGLDAWGTEDAEDDVAVHVPALGLPMDLAPPGCHRHARKAASQGWIPPFWASSALPRGPPHDVC